MPNLKEDTVLHEAARIIAGDREQTYGHPAKNLQVTADLWNSWLNAKGLLNHQSEGVQIEDVSCMMVLFKVARLANNPTHRDSQVDVCGYMRLLERCQKEI